MAECASANVTAPGPVYLLQLTVAAGPVSTGGAGMPLPPRPGSGWSPYPTQPRRYVLPPNTVTRSIPAMPVSDALGAALALDTAALPIIGVNTRALPTVPNSSRRLNLEFVKWSFMASRLQEYDIILPRRIVSAYSGGVRESGDGQALARHRRQDRRRYQLVQEMIPGASCPIFRTHLTSERGDPSG